MINCSSRLSPEYGEKEQNEKKIRCTKFCFKIHPFLSWKKNVKQNEMKILMNHIHTDFFPMGKSSESLIVNERKKFIFPIQYLWKKIWIVPMKKDVIFQFFFFRFFFIFLNKWISRKWHFFHDFLSLLMLLLLSSEKITLNNGHQNQKMFVIRIFIKIFLFLKKISFSTVYWWFGDECKRRVKIDNDGKY